jgi:hypothetical protein
MDTEIIVFTKYVQQVFTQFYNFALENLGAVYNFSWFRLSPVSPQIFVLPKETNLSHTLWNVTLADLELIHINITCVSYV